MGSKIDLTDKQINSLYNDPRIKVYVSSQHSEGWGLSLFDAACAAMQGMLASSNKNIQNLNDPQKAMYSFIIADELLKQENL